MKKIILSICLLSGILSLAQNEEPKEVNVLYADFSFSVGGNTGLTYEYSKNNDQEPKLKKSSIFKVHYISSTLDLNNKDIDGNGIGAEIGTKTYYNKNEHKGFYGASYITAGSIKFDEKNIFPNAATGASTDFDGTYTYLSLFSPELGYKLLIGNKVAINLHMGTSWLIEFKGKGDVDNKSFDNWVLNGGFAIGYNF
jgi:hypothetical protein